MHTSACESATAHKHFLAENFADSKEIYIFAEINFCNNRSIYEYGNKNDNKIMNKALVNNIREYLKTKPISKAWLFGSFARGEEQEDSDVDILIQFLPDAKMGLAYFGMICDLEDLLKRPVDLVVDGDLLPFAQESANHDKILIYERAA